MDALQSGRMPCTLDDLTSRFQAHLARLTKGKDPSKVRIVVES